jgi:uncharacterized protein YjbK
VVVSQAALKPGQLELLTQTFLLKKRRGAMRIESIDSDAPVTITRAPSRRAICSAIRICML